jgi:hypothetical protein
MFQFVFFWDVAVCQCVIGGQHVLNHQAPVTQWHSATLQKNGDLNCTTLKA